MPDPKATPQDGAALLAKYLKKEQETYEEFGKRVNCTKAHICGIIARKSSPSWALAQRIDVATEHRVPLPSWAPPKASGNDEKRRRPAA
jgi:hypothetical protein